MTLAVWQIIALILVAAGINLDRRGLSLTHARPAIVGLICGLILGDVNSGLYIGGTFTLMSLGVAAIGGSSVPDYGVATIIACAFAQTTGQGPEGGPLAFPSVCWACRWTCCLKSATPLSPRRPSATQTPRNSRKCTELCC